MTAPRSINFTQKLALFDEAWSPRVVAEMNDYQFKLFKARGEFVWHQHDDTDEVFIVLKGVLHIDLEEGAVQVGPGEMYVVPRGVRHRPRADDEVQALIIEPKGVKNTGEAGGALSADNDVWV